MIVRQHHAHHAVRQGHAGDADHAFGTRLQFGVETVGIDAGQAGGMEPPFPVHHFLLGADKYGLTQLQNLDQLPREGAVVLAAPLPIVGGTGSPTRVFALVPA